MSNDRLIASEGDSPCVHCGLCLDTCPTYRLTGLEAESPRGRLYLMNAVLDGVAPFDRDVIEHLDSCLGCLACESACPSGVRYGRHIEEFRPRIARSDSRVFHRVRARMARAGTKASALRVAGVLASALDHLGLERIRRHIPALGLMPRSPRSPRKQNVPPPDNPRLRVALLVGCVADRLKPSITAATVDVLHRNDVAVVLLPHARCCGALDLHAGNPDTASRLAAETSRAAAGCGVDYVVTTAAGCGAMLRHYEELFTAGEAGAGNAGWVSRNARDICELLVELGVRRPRARGTDERAIAYHDACHLIHGCGIDRAPRDVLTIAGVRWFDLGENAICCGSAGAYNLVHPRTATDLARRKVDLIAASGAAEVAVGNIGCIMQLERALARARLDHIGVWHPVELLDAAYRSESLE